MTDIFLNYSTLTVNKRKETIMRNVFAVIIICAVVAESFALELNRLQRSVDTCGKSKIKTGLIVRGRNFSRGTFPWIVALSYKGFGPPKFFCGGTLISKTFVISGEFLD